MIQSALLVMVLMIQAVPVIDVVYPRTAPGEAMPYIARVDSNFIFGSVQPPGSRLWIDGIEAKVNKNGSFLAFQKVDWNRKSYLLKALLGNDSSKVEVTFSTKPVAATPPVREYSPGDFPRQIELSGQPLRTDPRGTYFLFPTAGTKVTATSFKAGNFRIPLTADRSAWVEARTVRNDGGKASLDDPVSVWRIDIDSTESGVSLFLPIDRKLLVRLADEPSPAMLTLELFGAVSHIDKISYPAGETIIREVTWEQIADSVIRLRIGFNGSLWGYSGEWEEKGYRLTVRNAPAIGRRLEGLCIAIDPGHGGKQDGSIGPTGLKEKDANLRVAKTVVERLRNAGATVLLTLDQDSTVGLPDRTGLAESFNADLLISLHHNALPDGVNPFGNFGTGTYYYRPQSHDLAVAVQNAVVSEFGLWDEGVYYNDLALVRPTFQPGILLESAYIMLPEQETLIGSSDYPSRLARAIEKGVATFVHERLTNYSR